MRSGKTMSSFYGMQRANGDWFAFEDKDRLFMPVFPSSREATIARSRDSGMECFRPVLLDTRALERIKASDGNSASFLIVSDPLRNLKRGRRLDFTELARLVVDFEKANQNKLLNAEVS
jgi:hypothetical protein